MRILASSVVIEGLMSRIVCKVRLIYLDKSVVCLEKISFSSIVIPRFLAYGEYFIL